MDLLPPGLVGAFGLFLARTSALVITSPLLGLLVGPSSVKVALIGALSLVSFTVAGGPYAVPMEVVPYACMLLRELLIGLFLGFLLQIVMLAVRVAGTMVGHEMGFAMAQQADPATGIRTGLVTRFYEQTFLFGLLALNGHHWIVRSLVDSFERAPVGELSLSRGLAPAIQELFAQMFEAGMTFAAPVMVLLSLVSVLIGLLSRAVPQINVLELGFGIRISLALVSLMLFAPLLAPALEGLYGSFRASLDGALDALRG